MSAPIFVRFPVAPSPPHPLGLLAMGAQVPGRWGVSPPCRAVSLADRSLPHTHTNFISVFSVSPTGKPFRSSVAVLCGSCASTLNKDVPSPTLLGQKAVNHIGQVPSYVVVSTPALSWIIKGFFFLLFPSPFLPHSVEPSCREAEACSLWPGVHVCMGV